MAFTRGRAFSLKRLARAVTRRAESTFAYFKDSISPERLRNAGMCVCMSVCFRVNGRRPVRPSGDPIVWNINRVLRTREMLVDASVFNWKIQSNVCVKYYIYTLLNKKCD